MQNVGIQKIRQQKFINMPERVVYDGEKFIIKIRKRSHTPNSSWNKKDK